MKNKILAAGLALVLILSLLAGCGDKTVPAPSQQPAEAAPGETAAQAPVEAVPTPTPEPEQYDENGKLIVPFVQTQELSVWDVLGSGVDPLSSAVDSALGEILNLSVSYCYATEETAAQQFDLMVASGEYSDMMLDVGEYYPGGADKAIDDGVIAELEGVGKEIPNAVPLLQDHSDYFVLTESERFYQFPVVITGSFEGDATGLATRKDGLDYLEITSPETYDEFYFLLAMLKNLCGGRRGYLLPDSGYSEGLAYGYGAYNGFYQVGNIVKYGFLEKSFKDYMDFVYVLLDNRLAIFEQAGTGYTLGGRLNSRWVTCWYGGADQWSEACGVLGEDKVAAITWPVPNKGDSVHLIETIDAEVKGMSISQAAYTEKREMIYALVNYLYSDEFTVIANCGVEGDTFTYDESGQVVLSDAILNAESPENALKEVSLLMNLPHQINNTYAASAYTEGGYSEALTVWSKGVDGSYLLPELEISDADQAHIDEVMADIQVMADEFLLGYIQGDYDAYDYEEKMAEMTELGIRDIIDIYQIALTGEPVIYVEPEETLADKLVPSYSAYGSSPVPVVSAQPTEDTPADGEAPAEGETPPEESVSIEGETPPEESVPIESEPVVIVGDPGESPQPTPSVTPSAEPSVEPSAEPSPSGDDFGIILDF